jgi:hypothetical protein
MGYNPLYLFWRVTFHNGDILAQFKPNGEEVSFKEVVPRLTEIRLFELVPFNSELASAVGTKGTGVLSINICSYLPIFALHLGEGQRLIFFRRNYIDVGLDGQIFDHRHVYVLGYQETTAEGNRKIAVFYDPKNNLVTLASMKGNSQNWSHGESD